VTSLPLRYLQLTKPTIMLLVVAAGATAAILEGSLLQEPWRLAAFLVGLFLSGGSANALNQFFERDIDARMARTCGRRPLPLRQVSATQALVFSLAIGVTGIIILGVLFNLLTAGIALGVILFYSLVYTLGLKPSTSQNIVIGGIAGAMAPVGAWTAATGTTGVTPWLLFLIIFLWTPPHFWALALHFKDDYEKANLPMMPNTAGDESTLRQMFYYTLALVAASLALVYVEFGWIYLVTSIALGATFVKKAHVSWKTKDPKAIWGLFKFSIWYLFALFVALVLDKFIIR